MFRRSYLCACRVCGRTTSRKYATDHDGQCKSCFTGTDCRSPREPNPGYASEQTSSFRSVEADLDNCPY